MTLLLVQKLWELAAPANPTDAQMTPIIQGWERLFRFLGLREDEEEAEFDAIMQARLKVGVISIVPDRVINYGVARLGGAYMEPPEFLAPLRRTKPTGVKG